MSSTPLQTGRGDTIQIFVQSMNDSCFPFVVCTNAAVSAILAACGRSELDHRVVAHGRQLNPNDSLLDCGLCADDTVFLAPRLRGGSATDAKRDFDALLEQAPLDGSSQTSSQNSPDSKSSIGTTSGDRKLVGKELSDFLVEAVWPKKPSKFKAAALLIAARFPATASLGNALSVLLEEDDPPADVRASCVRLIPYAQYWREVFSLTENQINETRKTEAYLIARYATPASFHAIPQPQRIRPIPQPAIPQYDAFTSLKKLIVLEKIPDYTSPKDLPAFKLTLAAANDEIRHQCVAAKVPQAMGVRVLRTILAKTARQELAVFEMLPGYSQIPDEKLLDEVFRALASVKRQENDADWKARWHTLRGKQFDSSRATFIAYQDLLSEFTVKANERAADPLLKYTEFRDLLSVVHSRYHELTSQIYSFEVKVECSNGVKVQPTIQSFLKEFNEFESQLPKRGFQQNQFGHDSNQRETPPTRQPRDYGDRSRQRNPNQGNKWQQRNRERDSKQQDRRAPQPRDCTEWVVIGACANGSNCRYEHAADRKNGGIDMARGVPVQVRLQISNGLAYQAQLQAQQDQLARDGPLLGSPPRPTFRPPPPPSEAKMHAYKLPSPFRPITGDSRPHAKLFDDSVALLDSGGQTSICGPVFYSRVSRKGISFQEQAMRMPITGVGNTSLFSEKQFHAIVPLTSPSGTVLRFSISMLYLPDYKGGVVIGVPDLALNGVTFLPNPDFHAVMRGVRISCQVRPASFGSIAIGGASIMRAEVVQLAQQSQRVAPCSNECEVALAKLGRAVKVAQSSQGSSTRSHRCEIALAKPDNESSLLQDPSDLLTAEDFPSETKSIRVPPSATKTNRHISSPHTRASPSDFQGHAMQDCIRSFQTSVANNETVLTGTEASYIVFLLARFQKRFVDKLPYFGGIKGWEYCLKDQLKDPLRRIIRRPYPLKNPDREILFRTIEADISAGYRRNALPADIQCTAPIFVIYQRGQARVVANYQELNKNTHVDQWPCGTTDNTVDKISVSKYKAILDAKSGFSQMKKAKFTVSRTVAVTQDHTVESDGVDFGLCNALQCFCRLMHQMYHGWPSIHRHVDDLIVHSNTFKDFFQGLVNLLATAEDRNLFFKRSKLSIAPRVFRAVAHVFEGNTKRPDDSRLAPIRDIGPASTTTQTRSLLGMLNFWKDFIPNLQLLNSPIRAVLTAANARGSRKVRWTPEADAALCALKAIVCKKAFLHFPVYDKVSPESPFILHTDASGVAWGYLLTQTIDSKEFILKCGSRTFRKHNNRGTSIRRSCSQQCRR